MSDGAIKWINGLRGIASFLVIMTHLARGWDYALFDTKDHPDASPRLLQLPVLRIPWQGRIGVAIFAFVTGYVCAIKPLDLARRGNPTAALKAINRSAFRRVPRLVLPAMIITAFTWFITQFHATRAALRCDAGWLRDATAYPSATWYFACWDLYNAYKTVWTNGFMVYDRHQWTLLPLLIGAMNVFIALTATVFMRFRYRITVYSLLVLYYHLSTERDSETFGQMFMAGLLFCDISNHPGIQAFFAKNRRLAAATSGVFFAIGLFVCSYPQGGAEWTPWSRFLMDNAHYIFPRGPDLGRRYTALGIMFLLPAIWLSDPVKALLSTKPVLWLGKQSFAVYLIHGTILRTVLVWMLYGITGTPWEKTKNEAGEDVDPQPIPRRGPVVFYFAIPTFIFVVYACAIPWTNYVDAWCARVTRKLENLMFEEEGIPLV